MFRTFKYPLRPTRAQAATLTTWLGVCCDLYNAALQERKEAWRVARKAVTNFDQIKELTAIRSEIIEVSAVPVEAERSSLRRVDLAFRAFFRRCKAGEAPGYPRFRSRRRYDSFSFPFVRVDGNRVRIPKLGLLRFHRYRPLAGDPICVTIGRETTGKWFVSFDCDTGDQPTKIAIGSAVGIDLGLTTFATLSDGGQVPNPRWFHAGAAKLKRRQQTLSRRIRGSTSRERARIAVARAHAHIANQRRDFGRKLACTLFSRYDLIAHEDLEIRRMVGGHLAKSIGGAAWGTFLHALHCKAENAGKHAVAVDPRGTTQRCSVCGATVKKTLADRTHACSCGVTIGRDHNAALNVLWLGRSQVEVENSSTVETENRRSIIAGSRCRVTF